MKTCTRNKSEKSRPLLKDNSSNVFQKWLLMENCEY